MKTRKIVQALNDAGIRNFEFLRGEYEQLKVVVYQGGKEKTVLERWGSNYFEEGVPGLIASTCINALLTE